MYVFRAIVYYHGNHHLPATAKMYPIYGTQWHPEKNAFEWAPDQAINHSDHAVLIAQRAANFFVNEGECLICWTHSPMCFQIMKIFHFVFL